MKCNNCGQEFNEADLSLVFHHEGACLATDNVRQVPHSGSSQVVQPEREKTLDELIAEEEAKERDEFDERKNWFNQR